MSTARRLQAMYESKQQEWEVVCDRLTSLRQARTIETDPENKFKFDQRIKVVEQELKALQNELTQLEQQISQLKYIDHESPAVTSSAFVNKNYGAEAKNHINYPTPSLSAFLRGCLKSQRASQIIPLELDNGLNIQCFCGLLAVNYTWDNPFQTPSNTASDHCIPNYFMGSYANFWWYRSPSRFDGWQCGCLTLWISGAANRLFNVETLVKYKFPDLNSLTS